MCKTNFRRIVQRLVMLSVLVACLGVTATAPDNVQAATAACPNYLIQQCIANDGHFNMGHSTCSLPEDVYACEQGGGTWNYHTAQCQ